MKKENKFVITLNKFAIDINQNKYLNSIKEAFNTLIPFVIIASFTLSFSIILLNKQQFLPHIGWLIAFLQNFANFISNALFNFLTIFIVFLIGNKLGQKEKINSFLSGLIALVSYFLINLNPLQKITNLQLFKKFFKQCTSIKGLLLGILIALFSVQLYVQFIKLLKRSTSVSSVIIQSFSVLLTIIIIFIIGCLVFLITHLSLLDIIYGLIQKPLQNLVKGLPGILLLVLITQMFWIIGLHGIQIIKPFREPLLITATIANIEAYFIGKNLPNIVTIPFWNMYINMSGSGVTIGLLFAIFLTKRKYQKKRLIDIAKTALIPGIFNINEKVIFGIPIVLNRIFAIPFIVTPLVTGTIGYIATATGFAPKAYAYTPCPIFIDSFLATGGNWRAVITQIICVIMATLIYLPFVKEYENQKVLLKV